MANAGSAAGVGSWAAGTPLGPPSLPPVLPPGFPSFSPSLGGLRLCSICYFTGVRRGAFSQVNKPAQRFRAAPTPMFSYSHHSQIELHSGANVSVTYVHVPVSPVTAKVTPFSLTFSELPGSSPPHHLRGVGVA